MDVHIEVRRVVEHLLDPVAVLLVTAAAVAISMAFGLAPVVAAPVLHTQLNLVPLPGEVLVIEEIDVVWPRLTLGGTVEVDRGHVAGEVGPVRPETNDVMLGIEEQRGPPPAVRVTSARHLRA